MSTSRTFSQRFERALRSSTSALLAELLAEPDATSEMAEQAVARARESLASQDRLVAEVVSQVNLGAMRRPAAALGAMRHPAVARLAGEHHTRTYEFEYFAHDLPGPAWSALAQGLAARGLAENIIGMVRSGVPDGAQIPASILAELLSHPDSQVRLEVIRASATLSGAKDRREAAHRTGPDLAADSSPSASPSLRP
jgi:hypothetical protein